LPRPFDRAAKPYSNAAKIAWDMQRCRCLPTLADRDDAGSSTARSPDTR